MDCYKSGRPHTNIDLTDPAVITRWPQLAPLSDQDVTLARALAGIATIGLLQQCTAADREVERVQLQHALTSRIVLEQAKGLLAERWHATLDHAFVRFRECPRWASSRTPEVAAVVTINTAARRGAGSVVFPADGNIHLLEIGLQAYHAGLPAHRPRQLGPVIGFLTCCCPHHLSDPGQSSGPGTSFRVPPD